MSQIAHDNDFGFDPGSSVELRGYFSVPDLIVKIPETRGQTDEGGRLVRIFTTPIRFNNEDDIDFEQQLDPNKTAHIVLYMTARLRNSLGEEALSRKDLRRWQSELSLEDISVDYDRLWRLWSFWMHPAEARTMALCVGTREGRAPIVRQLQQMQKLSRGWFDEDSVPPTPKAITDSLRFLAKLAPELPDPDVTLMPDGEILLHWDTPHQEAIVSIRGDDTYAYTMLAGEQFEPGMYEGRLDDEGLALDLVKYIEKIAKER